MSLTGLVTLRYKQPIRATTLTPGAFGFGGNEMAIAGGFEDAGEAALLLKGLPIVSYPTGRVVAIRVTVSPMDNATFRVPLVLATE